MDWIDSRKAAAILGMPKAGFYRMVKRLKEERLVGTSTVIAIVECWGGIHYPGQHWRFREGRIRKWLDDQLGET